MESELSKLYYDAGQRLLLSTGNLSQELNQTLNQLLMGTFRAINRFPKDAEGQQTDNFGTVIYKTSQSQSTHDNLNLDIDNVACVIDVKESLDMEKLRAAYERIAFAKRLKKNQSTKITGVSSTTVTLGIIFARDATVPIEFLAEELDLLNRQHPDREWTDMVVVLSKGIINYAAQFPGENVLGDFLLHAEDVITRYFPPMYVIIIVRPTGRFTFNKMCSFLMIHLMIFSHRANLPKSNQILEGTPKEVMTLTGYQYNLSGKLMPVPRQFYNNRYIPPRPFLIEDQQGNLLSTLQFIPWQDGGVVLLKGKLPLDGLLIFLGKNFVQRGEIVYRTDGQISYVLPITHADFMQMLNRIQIHTNMVIKQDPIKFVIQKHADEGSSSPFISRLYLGILRLRDIVFPDDAMRDKFDKLYETVIETLSNIRNFSQEISQMLTDHFSKLTTGEVEQLRDHVIFIKKPIDKELSKKVDTFLISAARTLKQGMQNLTKALGRDIGCLFKKQSAFENGIIKLEKDDRLLSAYLKETRIWSEQLITSRIDIEHNGWRLPKIRYSEISGRIHAYEPEILGQKVSDFVKFTSNRLICFVEDVTAHCLETKMPDGFTISEIPLNKRESDMPIRFQVTLTNGGLPKWDIYYHQSIFEET